MIPKLKDTVKSWGGNVKYLVATDIEHHIYIGQWAKEFPDAQVIGPEGLAEKREQDPEFKGTVKFSHVFTEKNKAEMKVDEAFDTDFETEYVGGHLNRELVFYYKPEKTLIEADLIFNLPATEQYSMANESPTSSILDKLFNTLMSTKGSAFWQKMIVWYKASAPDRASFTQSMGRIDKWDFDRIIPCHGDVIETGGKGIFRRVMAWHLEQKK